MSLYQLNNEQLSICVDSHGAELKSLKKSATGVEYLWDAKPEFWKRTSPVLFPIVGSLNQGVFRYGGKEYPMSQHGFARDMEFSLSSQSKERIKLVLQSNEETRARYPFDFALELGYQLVENTLVVSWRVKNCGDGKMYFSIGGHPAFLCPIDGKGVQTDYKLMLDTQDKITAAVIGNGGTLSQRTKEYALNHGRMDITADLFDEDALIIENNQAHKVSLCGQEGQPYLTVCFDAPLFGLWSPAKKNAPFICIEPWYGRCDRETFTGDLSEREWGNTLDGGAEFYAEYTIVV